MHPTPRRRATRLAILTAGAVTAALLTATPAFAAGGRTAFPNAKPVWASASADAGAAADDTIEEGTLALRLKDPAGAKALALAVATPGSAKFHQYISPSTWISTYAPPAIEAQVVTAALTKAGFTVLPVPADRIFVAFRGPASLFNKYFGAVEHNYRVGGHTLVAPSSTPSVDSTVGQYVSALSVDTGTSLKRPALASTGSPTATTASQPQCSQYFGQNTFPVPPTYGKTSLPTEICGYSAKQVRAITTTASTDGAGQTVAIVDAYSSPTIVSDTNTLSAAEGEPGISGLYSEVGVDRSAFTDQDLCQGEADWQGEQTLDVQSVHAVAPAAKILYSSGYNCESGLTAAVSRVLDGGLANIISNSYGEPEEFEGSFGDAINDAQGFLAAATGVTLLASSADEGDNAAAYGVAPQPTSPAVDPFWTGVGGTTVGVDKNNQIAVETGWGDNRDPFDANGYKEPLPGGFYAGAGGGPSHIYAEPAYQKGVVPDSLSGGARVEPDIAQLADPYTGFQIGISPILADGSTATGPYGTDTYGGTSLASPMVAAQFAVAQQKVGTRLGFANPVLYATAKSSPSTFRDVQLLNPPLALVYYSNGLQSLTTVTIGPDTTLNVTKGYDDVTGIGVLKLSGAEAMLR